MQNLCKMASAWFMWIWIFRSSGLDLFSVLTISILSQWITHGIKCESRVDFKSRAMGNPHSPKVGQGSLVPWEKVNVLHPSHSKTSKWDSAKDKWSSWVASHFCPQTTEHPELRSGHCYVCVCTAIWFNLTPQHVLGLTWVVLEGSHLKICLFPPKMHHPLSLLWPFPACTRT